MLGFYTLGIQLSQFVNHLANEINNSGHGKNENDCGRAWMLVGYVWKGMEGYGRIKMSIDWHG